jgi:hypothetical protein
MYYLYGAKQSARRAARRLIALHPKQNSESEQKWQTCLAQFHANLASR